MQRTSSCRFMAPIVVICTYVQRRQQHSLPWLNSPRNRACGRGRKEVKRGGGVKEGPPFDARAILGRPLWLPIDRSAYSNWQSNEGAWNTNPCMAQYAVKQELLLSAAWLSRVDGSAGGPRLEGVLASVFADG